MAKPVAPLFGFDARGQLGKAIVFADWKGRAYTRRYVVPANPRTTAQQDVRAVFRALNELYNLSTGIFTESWEFAAKGQPLTGRNLFVKRDLPQVMPDTDLGDLFFSSAAGGGPVFNGLTVTPGSSQLTIAPTGLPTLPTGWSIIGAQAAAIVNGNPHTQKLGAAVAGEDLTSPYSIVLTGLITGVEYMAGVWLKYMKPDGSTAYSIDRSATGTPT